MKPFLGDDFLLDTDTSRHLYHTYAENLPLIDYHCHISPREIFEDRRFEDLGQIWLGGRNPDGACSGDHYKWRLLRANGVREEQVTGENSFERFRLFAETLEKAIGNPMVHWCNMELRNYFDIREPLTGRTARKIWEECRTRLRDDPKMSARGLIRKSNVLMIGTTDDPADSLEWHRKLNEDSSFNTVVCPSFRPDKALGIQKPGFSDYMDKLAASAGMDRLLSVEAVISALEKRLEAFKSLDCRASDHGLDYVPFRLGTRAQADAALQKAVNGKPVSREEAEIYQTQLLLFLGRAYKKQDIAMQIHYSCLRNTNSGMFSRLGPDAGYDSIAQTDCVSAIAELLNALDAEDCCPKVILYSLNPADTDALAALTGCFQNSDIPGKIQLGSAWWFNDTLSGMRQQIRSLANASLLGNFVGMLTDSRSFLSYARHEYFRRMLCGEIGRWVENGEYPYDEQALRDIVEGICYCNAKRYFSL